MSTRTALASLLTASGLHGHRCQVRARQHRKSGRAASEKIYQGHADRKKGFYREGSPVTITKVPGKDTVYRIPLFDTLRGADKKPVFDEKGKGEDAAVLL
jgi:hypothetical protein